MNRGRKIVAAVTLVFLSFSCNNTPNDRHTDTITTGVVGISADESFAPIVQQEIDVFEGIYTQSGIVPYYVDEVEAIRLLLADSVRLAVTTRGLTDQEKEYLAATLKFYVKEIKIATDGMAVIVNHKNNDSLMSVSTLQKIMTGQITNWKEVNPKSSLGDLKLVFDHPNSSTVRYAIDSICKGEKLAGNLFAQKNNEAVIEYVAQTPGAIGIIGAAWLDNKNDSTNLSFNEKIKVLAISKEEEATVDNSFEPYQAYLWSGEYPLRRNVYLLLTDPRNGLSSGLTSFIVSDRGQRILLKAGIVPATQPVRVVNVRDQIER